MYHTLTWVMWLCASAFTALVNGQPLQTLLLILAVGTVFTVAGKASATGESSGAGRHTAAGWGTFLRFGLWVWGVATIFNLLFAHVGRIVLFTLPRNWPLIGGNITLEGLLYGLSHGASLFAVLLVFATFNLALDSHRLLRWLPSGLFQAGLVVSIALSFIPQLMSSLQEIREAQRVRGHQFRGIRDWIPLFVPLITTALERSLTLAESMEARGFGGVAQEVAGAGKAGLTRSLSTPMTIVGLTSLLAGLLMRAINADSRAVTSVLLLAGTVALLGALYLQGRGFRRSHYRFEEWHSTDTYVTALSLVSLAALALIQWRAPSLLYYYPYPPSNPWPEFSPWVGLATSLLAAPALWWRQEHAQLDQTPASGTKQVSEGLP
jgi:energy-coupling factor transport system permease protein